MRRIKYNKVRKVQPNFFEYTGNYREEAVEMQLYVYNEEGYEQHSNLSLSQLAAELQDKNQQNDVKWLNVHGLHDVEFIRKIGELIGLETNVISDILNVSRRSRIEELGEVLYFNIKSVLQQQDSENLQVEQISFLLKGNLLVSFQEKRSDFFGHLRERICTGSGIVRKRTNDYLLYLLLDAVMENFFITLERFEDRIEKLIVESKTNHRSIVLEQIEKVRENLNFLKRSVIPLRDALYTLKDMNEDQDIEAIKKNNYAFFARLHQKSLEILDQIEYDTTSVDSASNIFFSSQSQRMNQIMKTLTIFSVIFMPLTFIVGVYGMNFDNMPELRSQNGYYIVLGVMFVTVLVMVTYFKRKRWF